MEQQFSFHAGIPDWMARRLTPRRLYPPRPKKQVAITPSTRPKLIEVPDTEAIGVQIGKYQSNTCLLVQMGLQFPFREDCLVLAQKSKAQWNDVFNLWEIPIFSQSKKAAIYEVWDWLIVLFFEHNWNFASIPIYWNYGVSNEVLTKVSARIDKLNSFWESGEIEYKEINPALVYTGLSRKELEKKTEDNIRSNYPFNVDFCMASERSCVNYLRHKESAYHLLLKAEGFRIDGSYRAVKGGAYQRIFKQINEAIAQGYPWLADECKRQIELKQGLAT